MTPHHAPRRAYTLIEMLAAMAMFSIVLTVAMGLLALLVKLDGSARRHTEMLETTARLARMFRADVRAANNVEPTPAGAAGAPLDRIALVNANNTRVQYEVTPRSIRRSVWRDGTQLTTERFRAHGPDARFRLVREGSHDLVALEFSHRPADRREGSLRPVRVTAHLGADARYQEAPQ